VDELRYQMEQMQLKLQEIERSKLQAEAETQKLKMQEMQAKAKSAGPVDKKNLSGPGDDVKVIRSGYLMKASGGKKDASGKKKRSMGSMRVKWERRWFVLVEGADLDGELFACSSQMTSLCSAAPVDRDSRLVACCAPRADFLLV
jgi:hypothetical protein